MSESTPQFLPSPPVARFGGRPLRRRGRELWRRRGVRGGALVVALTVCGAVILALVRDQTGTEGFLVGLALAVLPVPALMAVFRWLDRVDPGPWRNLFFAFAWGSCAAALVAIIANSFATEWLATATADPSGAQSLGATAIAPVIEESAKGTAVLLLFLFRRRHFTGVVDGVVFAGFTATGFAFTENILYLGNAFGEDRTLGGGAGLASFTVATFFVRIVLSPFAHPLFTVLTGIGFGLSTVARGRHGRLLRVALPLAGLFGAMGMHALWNSSSGVFPPFGFYLVYGLFMVPVFGLVTWVTIWARQRDLRTVSAVLPAYVAAGWFGPAAPYALSSMRARTAARDFAGRTYGATAARAVAEHGRHATALAMLRHQAEQGVSVPDFAARERELLHRIWERREPAGAALLHAARATGRVPVPPPYLDHWAPNPYREL
ncbi:PrsW family intramembrane metalloprotease [Streptomyces sp. NBC_01497]|uniref:PrsW family intramembrane metalloprotease n=1 Tax=Streptomyces sp. NBC_01497 TaxID=2903885 RepID=UPI002E30B8E5|nr:PrsW family intramembrane metalloprotease [Streptomyces sp. NBC_01497]